jgi:starch phosphorylase
MSRPASDTRDPDDAVADVLKELALDLRWSFDHAADRLWHRLDPELWDATHNPWLVLQTVSRQRLRTVTADPDFRTLVDALHRDQRTAAESRAWFQTVHPLAGLTAIAYFSMEFMLSEALPIYSGGLGNVAGDQLKAASTLGVPVIGVGLLYQQGYFRQEIDALGHQQALYPFNDPGQLPVTPVRDATGEWLRLTVDMPGPTLWIRAWQVRVGRARIYLLDANDPANLPAYRGITSELYGGGHELRLKQELVLGIGGWRLLRALGINPEVCHLNEGHAAFAILERARSHMRDTGQPFDLALTITRAGNVFTTHTAVAAGFDRFEPALMEQYFRRYAEADLGIRFDELLALGRRNSDDTSEPFNMAYLAIRGSGAVNGVSRLHGDVSRQLFQDLFHRWPQREVPVTYVTNGVHVPTWQSVAADRVWEGSCGSERWHGMVENLEQRLRAIGDDAFWQMRCEGRKALVDYVRTLHARQVAARGATNEEQRHAAQVLDANTLTLGFARRFTDYKRPTLLLHDPQRLVRLLADANCPVQLVLAGKAHPEDALGQEMIRQWIDFAQQRETRSRVVFLSDYDVLMAACLVQGVDLWLNTPRRPWEASGTSGMKVLVNGGLNLSELDGWWAEAYSPEVGWAIGDGSEHGDDPAWEAAEVDALYGLLEREVIPAFYTRDADGIPRGWIARMRESMARLTPAYSADRAVRQYTQEHYLPAAAAFRRRLENGGSVGSNVLRWRRALAAHWSKLRFGTATVERRDQEYSFQVHVHFDTLDPDAVRVELFAEAQNGDEPFHQPLARRERLGGQNSYAYSGVVRATRPAADFALRIVPQHPDAAVPLEASCILWCDAPSWR